MVFTSIRDEKRAKVITTDFDRQPLTTGPQGPTGVGSDSDWRALLEELSQRRGEFQTLRYVPGDFIAKLKAAGIYRVATPARFGGNPLPPATFLRIIERISEVDGSTGWVASFGSSLIYLAALPLDTQEELYKKSPDVVFAGGLFPVQPTVGTANGFLLNGRWKFASGSIAADILGVGIAGDGDTSGKPRTALLAPEEVEIIQDWDVSGMRATGSFDLVVSDVEVRKEWTFVRGGTPTVDEPLYRYPPIAYAAQVLAVVGVGVARSALDFAQQTGAGRAGVTGAPTLADRPYYREGIARAEAELRSARAYFYEATEEAWATVASGDPVSPAENSHLRLSAAHVAAVAADVVRTVYSLSGTAGIYNSHPLALKMRDAEVPPQHAFLGPALYESAGAVFMGLEPTVPGFR
jgi:alkylation response protein AidB-like acyl-CoA dehydrogenase